MIDLWRGDALVYRANIFKAIKTPLVKVIFVSLTVKMAHSVRKSLKQSENMGNQHLRNLNLRLYMYTLVPIVFGLLFLPHEMLSVAREVMFRKRVNTFLWGILSREDVIFMMAACTYTLASITYYAAFLILFRSVREAFCVCTRICKAE